ncbi:SDT1 [Candida pseudojiufengensis]|uniref:SDT1 n=1 Tax=Candida pseudojiufengensis TaxID=497109 RepID=UPI00222437DE|nr:SDT1 [Candida pseudojiufengensis]KAI5958520.1 SDT1 [Candida pseudojiufengensis]
MTIESEPTQSLDSSVNNNIPNSLSRGQPVTYINPELTELENAKPGRKVSLPFGYGPVSEQESNKTIFYFDIDNCLYQKSTRIFEMMQVKIHDYFKNSLKLNDEEASKLHLNYYKTYGLAIEGLVRNHKVDALEYNSKVDDALDLHAVLRYDKPLRDTLLTIKNSGKFDYLWLVTNAYKNHALRVISFLGIGDLFYGLTYCDYSKFPIICKPMKQYFLNVFDKTRLDYHDERVLQKQWFIDDSELNVKAAFDLGVGHVVHYVEESKDLEKLKSKDDFKRYYKGENRKILILSNFAELPKLIGIDSNNEL